MSLYSLRRMAVDVPSPAVPLYSPPGASDTFPSPTSMADPLPSLKPNLAIILVGLGFTFMLVCAFALFAKCMNPHLQRRRNLGWNLDLESPRGGDKDGPGVDPSVINALPLVFYKRRASSSLKRSGSTTDLEKALGSSKSRYRELEAECAVCLSIFEEGEQLRQLPECRHSFHPQCVDSWLGSHPSCPLCRRSILPSHDRSAAFVPQESQRLRIGDLSDAVVASSRGGVADADSSAGTVAALQQSPEIIVLGDVPGLRTPSPQHLPAVVHIPSSPIAAGSGNEDQVGVGSPSDNLQKPAYVADFVAVPVNESSNLREGPQGEGINPALPAVTSASPRHSGAP